jgi:hypothetical protein
VPSDRHVLKRQFPGSDWRENRSPYACPGPSQSDNLDMVVKGTTLLRVWKRHPLKTVAPTMTAFPMSTQLGPRHGAKHPTWSPEGIVILAFLMDMAHISVSVRRSDALLHNNGARSGNTHVECANG